MAKLENLRAFDNEFRMATADIRSIQQIVGNKGVWSDEQQVQLSKVIGALVHLSNAIQYVVQHNR